MPVPRSLGLCTDESVNGAPFFVMGFVDGHVVRDRVVAELVLTPTARRRAGESMVDTMAAIHAVDLDACGLADLGRHEGYIARQLKRWYGQWNDQKTRDVVEIDRVHDALVQCIPEQGPATLVHGDYRLDNCIVGDDGTVKAVLDWEICTLGDPLADVGMLQVYWTGPNDADLGVDRRPPPLPTGFVDRADLIARYATVSGRDLSQLPFYVSFAYWKLACILQGVYYRYLGGALGSVDAAELEPFVAQIDAAATPRHGIPRGTRVSDPFALHEPLPSLQTPVLVVMLTGWIDASGAAAAAMTDVARGHWRRDHWRRSTATRSSTTGHAGRRWSCVKASTCASSGPTSN